MIIVKGRELLIPGNERYIGTNYDAGMENRLFRIPRYSQSGTDLSDLTFKINLIFDGDPLDRAEMMKAVDDDYIYLTWTVTEAQAAVTGTVFVCITGNDTNDTVKWSSFQAAFYTEKSLGDDIDTAYHDLVNKVAKEITDRESAVAAEKSAREAADTTLQQNINAEASERAAGDAAVNTRIDNIVAQSGDDITEIVDARVGADGTTYTVLKNRLDAEHTDVKNQLVAAAYGHTKTNIFERGNLDSTDGTPVSGNARARSTDYIIYADTDVIVNPCYSEVRILVFYYDENNALLGHTDSWDSSAVYFVSLNAPDDTAKYKILARMSDNNYIDDAELRSIQQVTVIDNTGIPGGNLPYVYPVRITDKQKQIAKNNIGILHMTRNLWPHGDQTGFTQYVQKSIVLAAGTYVVSAEITSTKDGAEAPNYNARMEFRSGTTNVLVATITRYGRASVVVTLPSAVDNVRLFASNTSANSAGCMGNWRNIQIESGTWLTPYIPHEITGDAQEINTGNNDELFAIENVTIDGFASSNREWNFIFNRQHKDNRNVIIDVEAKYTGENANNEYVTPIMRAYYSTADQGTCYYGIGGKDGQYRHTMYRLPPFPDYSSGNYINYIRLQLIVPAGFSLTIKKLTVRYDDMMIRPMDSGLQIDTHLAFMFYPQHTYTAAEAAQRCGATRMIVIPKCSSDGVWFAYHDDTFDLATTILRNSDGSTIESSIYDGLQFSQIPWSYLKDLTVFKSGGYEAFPDVHLMRIDEFFKLCGRTGVHPMFSLHPVLTNAEYQSLYALAKKYGVLKNLTLKPASADTAFPRLVSVFGNEIESYGLITQRSNATDSDVQTLITTLNNSGLDGTKVKLFVELWADLATPSQIAMILDAGYAASLAGYSHTDAAGTTGTLYFSEADYNYWTGLGVTEFTENHNPSLGLDW